MTKDQHDAILRTLAEFERLTAENIAMQALLEVVQKHGAFKNFAYQGQDSTWREEVDYLMKGKAREAIHAALLQVRIQIEQAFQDAELTRLLAENPPKGPVN